MVMQRTDQILKRSAVATPDAPRGDAWAPLLGDTDGYGGLFLIAQMADEIVPWGTAPMLRDRQLREFLPTEHTLISAVTTVAARNAAFAWSIDGGDRNAAKAQDILTYANVGAGWEDLMVRLTLDMLSQDNGGFIEVIRAKDSATAEVIGLRSLDATRCYRTGDPQFPVLYTPLWAVGEVNRTGQRILLPWYRVMTFQEMPSNIERLRGLGYSAETRILKAAQLFRDITQFQREKMAGREPGAIHLVAGVSPERVQDAMDKLQAASTNKGLYRYMTPLVLTGLKPGEPVSATTLEFKSLPPGFDAAAMFQQYVAEMAMALLVDYQDLAPLPGGNLGTSTQSEVLARKTRGKGPALFQSMIARSLNFYGILPAGCTFKWDEQDTEEDNATATVAKLKAERIQILVNTGVYTAQVARQEMADDGDMPEAYLAFFAEEDTTGDVTAEQNVPVEDEAAQSAAITADQVAEPVAAVTVQPPQFGARERTYPAKRGPVDDLMDGSEMAYDEAMRGVLGGLGKDFQRSLRSELGKVSRSEEKMVAVAAEIAEGVVARTEAVEAGVKAAADAQAAAVRENTEAVRDATLAQARAFERQTGILTTAMREVARPKRRIIVRDDKGLVAETIEETI